MDYSNLLVDLLYQMAFADGHFSDEEKQFVSQIIEENNISIGSLMGPKTEIPSSEIDRMTIFYYLLFLIKIDGVVDEREKNFARKFGLALGFRMEMIDQMLTTMEKHLDNRLPDDELIKIVKQYLN